VLGKVAGALAWASAVLDRHMQIATDSRFKCLASKRRDAQKKKYIKKAEVLK